MMTGAIANLLLNVLIVVLLAVTIGYCWLLNRRIKVLQDSRSELALLLKHFDVSTQRASDSIIALQSASKKIGENIQLRIEKANYLLDDMSFMIEKGNKLANQMEAGFAVSRARERVMTESPPVKPAQPVMHPPAGAEPMEAEPEEESDRWTQPLPVQEKPVSIRDKTSASLEVVMERMANRSKMAETEPRNKPEYKAEPEYKPEFKQEYKPEPKNERQAVRDRTQSLRARSKSEQELLDMIKAGIKG